MKRTIPVEADDYDLPVNLQAVQKTSATWNGEAVELTLKLMLAGRYEILRAPMPLTQAKELSDQLRPPWTKQNETQATAHPPMTTPSETPDEHRTAARRPPIANGWPALARISGKKKQPSETKAARRSSDDARHMRTLGRRYPNRGTGMKSHGMV
jgi:hypothetical protein